MRNGLKNLRVGRGWTHEQAAEAMGMSRGGFIKIERGENQLTSNTIAMAAKVFEVSEAAVLGLVQAVPVVGLVGAGGTIETEWENQREPLFEVEIPFSLQEEVLGFQIRGDSMWPKYDSDDVIVVSRHGEQVQSLLGYEAVVRADDGNRYFKRVIATPRRGLFDLESYNAPTMRDMPISWASGLIVRVPASRWRKLNRRAVTTAVRKAKRA